MRNWLRHWVEAGGQLGAEAPHAPGPQAHHQHPWYLVLWLTGVDYFSTLGYQPGIALLAAGALSPIATAVLVAVTLLCALPVYAQVASRSYAGQGSIAMLENMLPGWSGTLFVLVLLGFAATDFVITMTLSAADAAQHAIENPFLHPFLGDARMAVTLLLLVLLAAVFLRGFSEAIGLATAFTVPYLVLNVIVLVRGLVEIALHPSVLPEWRQALSQRGDWTNIGLAAVLVFPRLALGLSGFETGVAVMPLIRGSADDERTPKPLGRIRNTRKLLSAAALIMSVLLLASSFVTAVLIPPSAYREGGKASGRAIAYLAHELLGNAFGSVYDLSTIVILWFAGASAMAGLLHLIPRYLPRLGMAPRWVAFSRPLVLVLLGADIIVTLVFRANVEAQGGAYATGVLVLMLSAAVASTLALWKEGQKGLAALTALVSIVFVYTLVDNVIERPDGIIIASVFIAVIILTGGFSRYLRAHELRVDAVKFASPEAEALWSQLQGKAVNMVPIRTNSEAACGRKEAEIRATYRTEGPFAFVHITLLDNRSEFASPLCINVRRFDGNYLIEVTQAIAIANTIAYLSEDIHPKAIFLGLTRKNRASQALRYLLFGEGETGLLVYSILVEYWESTPGDDVRPIIHILSD
jgi:hypothetical protein